MEREIEQGKHKPRRVTVRLIAIAVLAVVIVASAVFGIVDRLRVERRFDAIEQSNQETATALAGIETPNEMYARSLQVSTEILDAIKSMSSNMKDMTLAFNRQFAKAPPTAARSQRAVKVRKAKAPCRLWTEAVTVDSYGENYVVRRQLVPSKKNCKEQSVNH